MTLASRLSRRFFETELVAAAGQPELPAALAEQLLEDGFEQLPGPLPVGTGKSGAFRRCRQAQVLELAFGGGQPAADLTQRVGLAELTKQHGHQLAPAGEPAQVAVGVMLAHGLLEFQARKQLQKLGEDATETLMVEPPWLGRDCFLESYPTYQRLNHSREN